MTAMRSTNWDSIITSAPLDKQASVIRDGSSGTEIKVENAYIEQPPIRDFATFHGTDDQDLRGQRFGYLTVLGLSDRKKNWVFKCDCGKFSLFTTKGIRSLADQHRAMCGECDYVRRVQAGEIPSDARRLILRAEKHAAKDATAAMDEERFHPRLDALLQEWADVNEAVVISSMSRWLQRRHKLIAASSGPSTANVTGGKEE